MTDIKSYWKESPIMIVYLIIILAAISYAAWLSLVEMERLWGSREEYGYAYIIPAITAYFIWQNKNELQKIEYNLSWLGGVLLTFGIFLILLGVLSATHSIAQYGYIISIISTAFLFLGWQSFKVVLAPMLLLFLVVPLPGFIFNNLSADLQLISSQLGVWVIRAFGISVFLEGNVIDLGVFKLQVVEACSGLRYLFPLVSLSIIAAFLFQAALWKRVVLVLSSIPITVFMNSFRIGMIGVLVEYGGIEQAEGFLHDFEGWFVFMACVGLLVIEMWLLVSFGANKQKLSDVFAVELPAMLPADTVYQTRSVSWVYAIPVVFVVLAGFYIGSINEREEIIPERTDYSAYPLQLEEWNGQRTRIEQIYLDELKLDDYFIADYVNDNSKSVNLYMAYYESQRSGAAAHSPKSCIPGGGWRIKSHSVVDVVGVDKRVNRMLIQKGEYGQLVYYWFDQRGRTITNEYLVKWYLFWDSLTIDRTDGALVRLTTELKPGDDVAKADERLSKFVQLIQPTLSKYIPN